VGTGGFVHAVRTRLATPPLTLVASLAAALAFSVGLLAGWATAGTREQLQRAQPLPTGAAAPRLVLLGRAAPLPAPPPRPRVLKTARPEVPRLIVGSG
jgi:hypothetical protein